MAVGAYAIGFGAFGIATGFTVAQTMALSLLMFTGASQFALVGVVGAGGGGVAAALTALMLGLRKPTEGSVRLFGLPPDDRRARSRCGVMSPPKRARISVSASGCKTSATPDAFAAHWRV